MVAWAAMLVVLAGCSTAPAGRTGSTARDASAGVDVPASDGTGIVIRGRGGVTIAVGNPAARPARRARTGRVPRTYAPVAGDVVVTDPAGSHCGSARFPPAGAEGPRGCRVAYTASGLVLWLELADDRVFHGAVYMGRFAYTNDGRPHEPSRSGGEPGTRGRSSRRARRLVLCASARRVGSGNVFVHGMSCGRARTVALTNVTAIAFTGYGTDADGWQCNDIDRGSDEMRWVLCRPPDAGDSCRVGEPYVLLDGNGEYYVEDEIHRGRYGPLVEVAADGRGSWYAGMQGLPCIGGTADEEHDAPTELVEHAPDPASSPDRKDATRWGRVHRQTCGTFPRRVPQWDDWAFVGRYLGAEPITMGPGWWGWGLRFERSRTIKGRVLPFPVLLDSEVYGIDPGMSPGGSLVPEVDATYELRGRSDGLWLEFGGECDARPA